MPTIVSCLAVLTQTHAEGTSACFQSQTVGKPDVGVASALELLATNFDRRSGDVWNGDRG